MFTAISSLFVRPEDQGRCEFAERDAGNFILHASIHFDIIPASGGKNDVRGIREPDPSVGSYDFELRTEEIGILERV